MGSVASVFIDEVDVTSVALEGSSTRRLNRPSDAQVRLPMSEAIGGVGSLLKVYFDGTLHFHGRVLLCETTAETDTGYTVYNATDPLELWKFRPVRDPDGDFSKPSIIKDFVTGPQIIQAMMEDSENAGGGPPSDAEGPLFVNYEGHGGGTFATGGVDLTAAPTDWPMTMAQLASLLVSTGQLDIVNVPIELTDSGNTCDDNPVYNYGEISCYNGNYGTDRTASVIFQYGMGLRNIQTLRWNQDMTNMCNKLWYYLGPRVLTPADPAGDQHWRANVQGDDIAFDSDGNFAGAWSLTTAYTPEDVVTNGGNQFICKQANTGSAVNEPGVGTNWQNFWVYWMVPPGGRLSPPASADDNQIGVQNFNSRCANGVRMDIQVFDAQGDSDVDGPIVAHNLFRRRWQIEQWLRAQPQTLVHVTPTRDTEIGTFDIGDLVLVEASADVRGGFSGAQRIYEYTLSWDQDSVVALSELQVSADSAGFD